MRSHLLDLRCARDEQLVDDRTATLYGANAVGPAMSVCVAGVVVRSIFITLPDGFGCGTRITLSPASANVRRRGPFRPLAITWCTLRTRSKRVIVPASVLT